MFQPSSKINTPETRTLFKKISGSSQLMEAWIIGRNRFAALCCKPHRHTLFFCCGACCTPKQRIWAGDNWSLDMKEQTSIENYINLDRKKERINMIYKNSGKPRLQIFRGFRFFQVSDKTTLVTTNRGRGLMQPGLQGG